MRQETLQQRIEDLAAEKSNPPALRDVRAPPTDAGDAARDTRGGVRVIAERDGAAHGEGVTIGPFDGPGRGAQAVDDVAGAGGRGGTDRKMNPSSPHPRACLSPASRIRGCRVSRFARRAFAASGLSGAGVGSTSPHHAALPATTPL